MRSAVNRAGGGDDPAERLRDIEAELADMRVRLDEIEHDGIRRHEALATWTRAIGERLDGLTDPLSSIHDILAGTVMATALPPSDELVSVVMPTRNRATLVRRAIATVQRQTHAAWELLVVDDDSDDDTGAVLAEIAAGDERVRPMAVRGAERGRGGNGARNFALRHARGSLIAYLDDDNLMAPSWLRAVVWAFAEHPEATAVYGAMLCEVPGAPAPIYRFEPWSRRRLEEVCIVDQNVIAHRAGLREARFDETLDAIQDWDLFLRLTEAADPLRVPVVGAIYLQGAPRRLLNGPADALRRVREDVQRAALRRRQLRVTGTDGAEPALQALRKAGATTTALGASLTLSKRDDRALPDVALLASDATDEMLAWLERARVPFLCCGCERASHGELSLGPLPDGSAGAELLELVLDRVDAWRARSLDATGAPQR